VCPNPSKRSILGLEVRFGVLGQFGGPKGSILGLEVRSEGSDLRVIIYWFVLTDGVKIGSDFEGVYIYGTSRPLLCVKITPRFSGIFELWKYTHIGVIMYWFNLRIGPQKSVYSY